MTTAVIDPNSPNYDKPEKNTTPGELIRWGKEALARVLATNPEVLDWSEVDREAQREREERMTLLMSGPDCLDREEKINKVLDEYKNPLTAKNMDMTHGRSVVSIEMETDK